MGYWDKKAEQEVEEREQASMSLDEYEALAMQKLEDDGEYLSRKMEAHKERFEKVTSDGFWFCVVFNNDDQKEEFLQSIGLSKDERYIRGSEFARIIGKQLKAKDFDFGKEKLPVKEFKDRARPVYKEE